MMYTICIFSTFNNGTYVYIYGIDKQVHLLFNIMDIYIYYIDSKEV